MRLASEKKRKRQSVCATRVFVYPSPSIWAHVVVVNIVWLGHVNEIQKKKKTIINEYKEYIQRKRSNLCGVAEFFEPIYVCVYNWWPANHLNARVH